MIKASDGRLKESDNSHLSPEDKYYPEGAKASSGDLLSYNVSGNAGGNLLLPDDRCDVDMFRVLPESFKIIEFALVGREYVDNHGTVIKQYPA